MFDGDFERALALIKSNSLEEAIKSCPLLDDMKYTYLHRQEMARIAGELGIDWKEYVYHDCDKMVMMLFHTDEELTKEHRETEKHHDHMAWSESVLVEMMLDWESARFTKPDKPLNALGTLEKWYPEMKGRMLPVLKKYGLGDEVISDAISQEDFDKKASEVSIHYLVSTIKEYVLFLRSYRLSNNLHSAIKMNFCLDAIDAMVQVGAPVNKFFGISSPLFTASSTGNLELVKYFISHGAYTDDNDPILIAIRNGHEDVVDYLLSCGMGNTDMMCSAADGGHLDLVEKFIGMGYDVNHVDKYKYSPLFLAVRGGHFDVVKRLIEEGADINFKSSYFATPLFVAKLNGHKEIEGYLLSLGAKMYDLDGNETDSL